MGSSLCRRDVRKGQAAGRCLESETVALERLASFCFVLSFLVFGSLACWVCQSGQSETSWLEGVHEWMCVTS